jgi:site-specific DNA recombinase
MKIAIYTRVSTEDQVKEGTSLEVQENFLLDYAKRNNMEVFDVYCEDGKSGYTTERPELFRLFDDARKRKFDLVLVHKIDRFSRNLKNLLNLVDELEDLGVSLKSASEMYDTTTSAGKMMFQQLGSFAEFERNRIKERVFPGMINGIKKYGNWQGARYVPYGYNYDKSKKILTVIEKEAKTVKVIYKMYLSGQTTPQIAKYFYEKNYKTRSGGLFNTKFIRDILRNQIYIGNIVWNKFHYDTKNKTTRWGKAIKNPESQIIVAKGKHKAIIPNSDFDAVQKKLDANRRGAVNRKGCLHYSLTGILICNRCGHRYTGHKNHISRVERNKFKRYYRCGARSEHGITCNNPAISADEIENEVDHILEILCSQELTPERVKMLIKENPVVNDKKIRSELKEVKEKLSSNISQQEKFSELYAKDLLAIEAYKNKIHPLKIQENELKDKVAKLELNLIQKERSNEYRHLLQAVLDKCLIKSKNRKLDILSNRDWLKITFKHIKIENGKLLDFELYEPFKSLYEGRHIEWEVQENQQLAKKQSSVVTLKPSVVR